MLVASLDGENIAYKPLPKQLLAMIAPSFELLYGGSKGGAKTHYLVGAPLAILSKAHEKFLESGRKQHKCRVMVFRRNLEDLKDFAAKCHDVYPIFDPGAVYNVNEKTWTFSSGATVAMRHLDGPTDHLGYNGNEFVALLFDEVQQISYEAYSFLVAQVRSSDPDYRKLLMVRCTANPGGHAWVETHFMVDKCPEGGKIFSVKIKLADGREVETTRTFIRSKLKDNPYLDPDGTYEARLRATMTEDEVKMYLDGRFDVVAGTYFSKLLRPSLHFVKSRPIPGDWDMRFACDWGSTNPASVHVGALDGEGRLYVIDELHMPGITGRKFGEQMRDMWSRQKWCSEKRFAVDDFYGVIDKQAMDRYGGDYAAADGIMDHGFRLFPAQKDRNAGCQAMKERLLLDRFGQPQVVIFEDRCPALVAALSKIRSDAPAKPEEYDPKSEYAHACDSMRFLCMEFPVRNQSVTDPRDAEVRKWDQFIAKSRARQSPSSYSGGGYE